MIKKIKLVTLGCSKNRVDSEHLLKQIFSCGIEIEAGEEIDGISEADALLINTCGFIHDARKESVEAILEAVEEKRKKYVKHVYVFGCLSQRYGEQLKESIPEVDGFFGAFDLKSVLAALGRQWNNSLACQRYLTTPSHYAYLKISEGCDRSCSYCSIPLIRGGHISVPPEELVKEAEHLASSGVKELILVAQDTTYYGIDLHGTREITSLVNRLSEIDSLEWIRILYAYPSAFPQDLLKVISDNPKVCNYLDIPFQHISDKVLNCMRRGVDGKTTRELVEKFRKEIPDIVLRTTMIVGHPGEGKREFEELLSFVKDAKFERLGAFAYSEEEGTWGAANLKDRVTKREKEERYGRLMELQSSISMDYNISRIGSEVRILVDSAKGGVLTGRSSNEAPEVDGEVIAVIDNYTENTDLNKFIGTFVPVEITGADEYDLQAKVINA
jgi:ribosomal protein S12 methylthiotransferase